MEVALRSPAQVHTLPKLHCSRRVFVLVAGRYSVVMKDKKKTVLVFGTFDGLHEGHRFLLREARKLGDCLIASVATDEVVREIKKRLPTYHLHDRLKMLTEGGLVDEALAGDAKLGNWSAVKKWKPDIVAVGYDQTKLEEKLREYIQQEGLPLTVIKIDPHKPDRLHSRFLRKQ